MEIIRDVSVMRRWRDRRPPSERVGFVPTMGFLHDGHLALCRTAKEYCDRVVVSIFVNPTQFGPNEDLERYPRDEAGDLEKLEKVGIHAVFLPTTQDLYPSGFEMHIETGPIGRLLCGAYRPGHFEGVATIVSKFFHIINPTYAFFGLKDYQQYVIIKKMVQEFHMGVEIIGVPTLRESDGLAMSSRNAYLSAEERRAARIIPAALEHVRMLWAEGEKRGAMLEACLREHLAREARAEIEYVSAFDAQTLGPVQKERPVVVALALRIGTTRLIDNILLHNK